MLDLSRILAGPTCTQLLGDLGADVLKVERPGFGDDTRSWGPPFIRDKAGRDSDLSAYFLCANRNKRSIAIDIGSQAGADLIRKLARQADVIVENYKPGDLARRGLDYEHLSALKPDLVWCSITGFGRTGPHADRPGYDFLAQAMGGMMSITGAPDEEGGQPMKVGVAVADVVCGLYGILAALRHRDRTGEGQMIDLSLFDTQVAWLVNAATNVLASGVDAKRLGNRHPTIAPYQTFAASDGYLCVAVGNDKQFAAFCRVLSQPELSADPRFSTNPARVENRLDLEKRLSAAIALRPVEEWTSELVEAGVPAGSVRSISEVLSDPQTRARGMVIEMQDDAAAGPLKLLGNPLKMSATPPGYMLPPPHIGSGRDAALSDWLGMGEDEIAILERSGAFGASAAAGLGV